MTITQFKPVECGPTILYILHFSQYKASKIGHKKTLGSLYISLYQGAGKRPADLSDWQKCPRPEGPGAPAALGPKGRGLLSTLTKIVRTIHNHLYMKIIRSLHFCKFASAHYIKIQRNRKMSIFRFSFGD